MNGTSALKCILVIAPCLCLARLIAEPSNNEVTDAAQAIREVFENPTDPVTQSYRFGDLKAMPEDQVVTFAVAELIRPEIDYNRKAFAYQVLLTCNGAKYINGFEVLIDGLENENDHFSSKAATCLKHASDEHKPIAITALHQKLKKVTPKSLASQGVLRALSSFGPASRVAIKDIERVARDQGFRPIVRSEAFGAIVSIGGLDHPILTNQNLTQNEKSMRLYAVIRHKNEIPMRAIFLGLDEDPKTAKANAARLRRWSEIGVKLALEELNVADPALRDEALSCIAMFAQAKAAVMGKETGTFRLAPNIEKALVDICEHDASNHVRERACAIRDELDINIERMKIVHIKKMDSLPANDE